jgi:hypothetical protein
VLEAEPEAAVERKSDRLNRGIDEEDAEHDQRRACEYDSL